MKVRILFITILFVMLLPFSCSRESASYKRRKKQLPKYDELEEIYKSGILKVVVDYNSTNYFVYRGRPMGFQYELLKKLSEHMGVELEISVRNIIADTFRDLNDGKVNLVAKNLTITKARSQDVDFTRSLTETRQVLVQRKPEGWEKMRKKDIDKSVIRRQLDLAEKTVYVQKNTVFVRRLKNLSDEIGSYIDIVEDSEYGVEQLVALVAAGKIDYTVCDENVAMVNQSYYPNLDIETPVSFLQKLSWVTRKGSHKFKSYIDNWIISFRSTEEYQWIYNKYFKSPRSKRMIESPYNSLKGGKVSVFDELIKDEASKVGMDWRLIASIIYQESYFEPGIDSWAGASGLMQLMPETAERFDVENVYDPRQNIRGGLKLLKWLDGYFFDIIPDSDERIKFVLASYNAGLGHVLDARRLARKYGKPDDVWDENVDFFLKNKSSSKYYRDPIVKWGYCRGDEPYHYVIEILERYSHYLNHFKS